MSIQWIVFIIRPFDRLQFLHHSIQHLTASPSPMSLHTVHAQIRTRKNAWNSRTRCWLSISGMRAKLNRIQCALLLFHSIERLQQFANFEFFRMAEVDSSKSGANSRKFGAFEIRFFFLDENNEFRWHSATCSLSDSQLMNELSRFFVYLICAESCSI